MSDFAPCQFLGADSIITSTLRDIGEELVQVDVFAVDSWVQFQGGSAGCQNNLINLAWEAFNLPSLRMESLQARDEIIVARTMLFGLFSVDTR